MGSAVGPKMHVLFPPRTSALDWCSALAGASWALSVPAACPMAEPRHGPACVHVDRAQDWDGRPRTWGGGGGRPWQAARACCVGSLIDMVGHLLNQAGVSGARPGAPHQGSAGTWGSSGSSWPLHLVQGTSQCAGLALRSQEVGLRNTEGAVPGLTRELLPSSALPRAAGSSVLSKSVVHSRCPLNK